MNGYISNYEKPFRKFAVREEPSANIRKELAELVTQKLNGEALPDMLELITVDKSRVFIKKIFRKNGKKYIRFLRFINHISYWRTAFYETLKLYSKFRISYYSKEALELSDYIYLRYFPKDSYHKVIKKKPKQVKKKKRK